ncbi:MAG: anti-sigma factor domain-containing protein [Firmicutes bacterium]|nr:anti-sigma factor domain-containing protein [Bacillota bacterium]
MERLTGVVMERTDSYVVLMTPKGEFKRVRITGRMPDIGEEIRIPVVHKRLFSVPRASWLAVAAAVILLVVASPLLTMINQPPEAAVAYVSIDINPSIDLTVSDRYNVLDAQALNRDGEQVLQGVNLKGVKYVDAVDLIEQRAAKLGFIHKSRSNTVVVSVSFIPNTRADKALVGKTLLASANSIFAKDKIDVATIQVPSGLRESARKKGMSPGKYAVLIEAVNAGLLVTEKDMQEKPIAVAISSAGGQPDKIIGQAREEEQFDVKEREYLATIASKPGPEPTDASTGGQNDPAPVGITAEDSNKQVNQKIYVEPIRRNGGPEERHSPAKPADNPGSTVVKKPGVNTPADSNNDQKTDDNYMGSQKPNDTDSNINDMYKLKPNF